MEVPILDRPERRSQRDVTFGDLDGKLFQSSIAPKGDRNEFAKLRCGFVGSSNPRSPRKAIATLVKNCQAYISKAIANLPEKTPPLVVRVRESFQSSL